MTRTYTVEKRGSWWSVTTEPEMGHMPRRNVWKFRTKRAALACCSALTSRELDRDTLEVLLRDIPDRGRSYGKQATPRQYAIGSVALIMSNCGVKAPDWWADFLLAEAVE